MLPIDETAVQFELTRYLDPDNPNLGRYSACRRAARTLFLGSHRPSTPPIVALKTVK